MNYSQFMTILCEYYKQKKYTDPVNKIPNMQVAENFMWVEKNIPVEELEQFKKRVFENFVPTNENTFPLISHLKKIRDEMTAGRIDKYNPHYKTLPELSESLDIDKEKIVTANYKTISLDDRILSAAEMLKKYGVEQCSKIWMAQGVYCGENDIECKIMFDMKFNYDKIEKYIE